METAMSSCRRYKLIKYNPLQENELYKIHMIKELTKAKIGAVHLNISKEEIFDILQYLCCYWYGALELFILCYINTIFLPFYLLYVYFYVRGR